MAIVATAFVLLAGARASAAVVAIENISFTVADLDRTERFYRDGLGFTTVGRRHVADPAWAHLVGVEGAPPCDAPRNDESPVGSQPTAVPATRAYGMRLPGSPKSAFGFGD